MRTEAHDVKGQCREIASQIPCGCGGRISESCKPQGERASRPFRDRASQQHQCRTRAGRPCPLEDPSNGNFQRCARCGRGKRAPQRGFSLVEVVLALGLVSFVLLSVMALLPLGAKTNQISAEETRAANILTRLEADMRNARTNSLFGLPLPYALSGTNTVFNASLSANTLYTTGISEEETTGSLASSRYQASVIYTTVPPAGSLLPMEARLIVNWPALTAAAPTDLVTKSRGHVETFVTFPAP